MTGLGESTAKYEKALERLEKAILQPGTEGKKCQSELLEVLLARDEIAQAIDKNRPLKAEGMKRIVSLDQTLRDNSARISQVLGRPVFVNCRASFHPSTDSWWWFLETLEPEETDKLGTFFLILTSLFVTILISILTEVSRRFLCGDGDWPGTELECTCQLGHLTNPECEQVAC